MNAPCRQFNRYNQGPSTYRVGGLGQDRWVSPADIARDLPPGVQDQINREYDSSSARFFMSREGFTQQAVRKFLEEKGITASQAAAALEQARQLDQITRTGVTVLQALTGRLPGWEERERVRQEERKQREHAEAEAQARRDREWAEYQAERARGFRDPPPPGSTGPAVQTRRASDRGPIDYGHALVSAQMRKRTGPARAGQGFPLHPYTPSPPRGLPPTARWPMGISPGQRPPPPPPPPPAPTPPPPSRSPSDAERRAMVQNANRIEGDISTLRRMGEEFPGQINRLIQERDYWRREAQR